MILVIIQTLTVFKRVSAQHKYLEGLPWLCWWRTLRIPPPVLSSTQATASLPWSKLLDRGLHNNAIGS